VVVAAGPGSVKENGQRVEPRLRVGDRVLFGKFSGTEIELDGVNYVLMREDDVYGVFGAE
jgi:chaperonin GroES